MSNTPEERDAREYEEAEHRRRLADPPQCPECRKPGVWLSYSERTAEWYCLNVDCDHIWSIDPDA